MIVNKILLFPNSARTISEDWSSSGDSRNEEEEKEHRSQRDKDGKEKDKDAECKYSE